jgi:excinuclease ABC subunit C
MNETGGRHIASLVGQLPRKPGVYLFKDERGRVLYVGKAKNLKSRVGSYFGPGNDGRHHIQFMLPRVADIDFTVTDNEQEALILENNLIKKFRPRYNIFLRDDKTYVNLRLNVAHPYPRLTVVRNPRRDKALYFGPYPSAGAVRRTLRIIGRVFPMRLCSDAELSNRKRPCLYYDIKRCPAPCVGLIDPQEYKETVGKVTMFLKGKGTQLIKSLKARMERASAERAYEEAGGLRDQIWAIQRTLERQRITSPQRAERDVFAAYREDTRLAVKTLYVRDGTVSGGDAYLFTNAALSTGEHLASFISQYYQRGAVIPEEIVVSEAIEEGEALTSLLCSLKGGAVRIIRPQRGERRKLLDLALENARVIHEGKAASGRSRELLEDLQALLELRNVPRQIECFDISNIQGRGAVGSKVTFIDGEPARDLYRRYRIRGIEGANDYGMMEEVLKRRVARGVREGDLPDLLTVDGGKGQLNVALRVLDELGADDVEALAIAKVRDAGGSKKIKGKEKIFTASLPEPLLLEGNSTALLLLERIRDEAHRFAHSYHTLIRNKQMTSSLLDDIPGVGPKLKRRLLARFGGIGEIRRASIDHLMAVTGVSQALAGRIRAYLGGE